MEKTPPRKIEFKPLHEGMGFHPFSDGMPYAPISKADSKVNVPTQETPQFPVYAPIKINAVLEGPSTAVTQETHITLEQNKQAPSHTLLQKRFFAYLLDLAFSLSLWLIAALTAILDPLLTLPWYALLGIALATHWFLTMAEEVLFETTLGKVFFGLEFKKNHSSLFLRSIVFTLGLLFFGIGAIYRIQDRFGELTDDSSQN